MVKKICKEAGIDCDKTNHSLRVTGATAMFQANVPERVIQKTTGHKSLQSLRCYERISTEQHEEVSRVLMPQQEDVVPRFDYCTNPKQGTGSSTVFDSFVDCNVTINVNHV